MKSILSWQSWLATVLILTGLVSHSLPVDAQQRATARQNAASKQPADASDAQLRQRVEQLEEQLADMQVVIGTLESLGRGGNVAGARGGPSGGVDGARVNSLETQIHALAAQLNQMQSELRQLSGGRRGDAGRDSDPNRFGQLPSAGFGQAPAPIGRPGSDQGSIAGFGSTTVRPSDGDAIGQIIGRETVKPASAVPGLPPSVSGGNPRELYETAYGYLLQQDYGAAEVAFEGFLRRFPNDRLAADAQYWLGETLYVQRRYKEAGQAFLRVIEAHKTSTKIPNSLLKLAQSLDKLGQKDCGIFNELETRHANAPADVKAQAQTLKRRVGC